jgi:hypothetical protein
VNNEVREPSGPLSRVGIRIGAKDIALVEDRIAG